MSIWSRSDFGYSWPYIPFHSAATIDGLIRGYITELLFLKLLGIGQSIRRILSMPFRLIQPSAKNTLVNIYCYLLARKRLYRLNRLLFHLSLRGMGISNYENTKVSGERYLMTRLSAIQHELIMVDVGANVGDYSILLKRACPRSIIYAFEPHRKTFLSLQNAATKNGFEAINAGCGESPGTANLFDYEGEMDGSQHASIYKEAIEQTHGSVATSHEVEVTTIDLFMAERGLRQIDFLKVDTEGNEFNVLRGAKAAIGNGGIKAIQFEFNTMNVFSRTYFRDFYMYLTAYQFYRMLPDGFAPMGPYYPAAFEVFAFQNIIALHSTCDFFE